MSRKYLATKLIAEDLTQLSADSLAELHGQVFALLNALQEAFTRHILNGTTIYESYKLAGYSCKNDATAAVCGSKLLKSAKISNALKVQREMNRRVAGVNKDNMLQRFMALAQKAEAVGDIANAKGCLVEATKLADLYPAAKSETTVKHENDFVQDLTKEQLSELFRARQDDDEREVTH